MFYEVSYADGRPKKVALGFSLWAEIARYLQRLALSMSPESGLWALAGQNEAGERAILVVNPTNTATAYAVEGVDPTGKHILQVNDASSSVQRVTVTSEVCEIGSYTVQLLRLGR
jgi:hypothetical protein